MSFVINAWIAQPYQIKVFVSERFTVRQLVAKIEREFCRKYGFSNLKVYALQDPNHHDLPLDCKVNLLLKHNDRAFVIVHPDSFRRKPNLFHPLLSGSRKRPADTSAGSLHDQQRAVSRFRTSPSALNLSRSQLALNGISRSGLVTANDFLQAYFRLRENLIQIAPPTSKSPPSPRSLSPHSVSSTSDNDSPLSRFLSQPVWNEPASLILSSTSVPSSSASSSTSASISSSSSSTTGPSSSSSLFSSSVSSSSSSSSSSIHSSARAPVSAPSASSVSSLFSSLSSIASSCTDSGCDSDSDQSIRSLDSANFADSSSRRQKESEVVLQRLRQVARLLSKSVASTNPSESSPSEPASSSESSSSSSSSSSEGSSSSSSEESSSQSSSSSTTDMSLENLFEQIPETRKHLLVEIGRVMVEDLHSIDSNFKSLAELSNLCSVVPPYTSARPLSASFSSSDLSLLSKQEAKSGDISQPALIRSISSSSLNQRLPQEPVFSRSSRVPPSLPLQRAASAK